MVGLTRGIIAQAAVSRKMDKQIQAPTERDTKARGNALGGVIKIEKALKGRNNHALLRPFGAWLNSTTYQGRRFACPWLSYCAPLGLVSLVCLAIFASLPITNARELIRYEDSRVSMASTYTIVVYGRDTQTSRLAVNAAFDEVDRLDRLMSHYKPASPLSRLNREAAQQSVKTEAELFDFLTECLRYSRASDGAFDITVGALMKAWGFFRGEGRMPSDAELAIARARTGYQHLRLNPTDRTVSFATSGLELDLGGIAKGYAADRAVAVLKQHGIRSALVSAGGSTIYGLGTPPDQVAGWEVQLRDPLDARKTALTVRLKDRALSVSGNYEKFFELG
ncbi:MAG: FAD:protein FMN transferase, partial [Acidobacteria bacterium]|nr:FAD:protein FMN transferase [Acidobacteriota bacterium]